MHDNGNFEFFENFTNLLCILCCKNLFTNLEITVISWCNDCSWWHLDVFCSL